ncbi:hypothetical protein [Chondromyces apiculatus]|uniref:Uncharacterized protein n=1 Tax=Chondromyces apiculatus DSM 436 TaxID=1192034 RepID=A0A017T056_9BACT|nr:hypothetical protein [Chondromyces apiculatus]EYF02614.1 Hypothetical protein CAP_6643 [Chondromyces apiculatus DSM 436]
MTPHLLRSALGTSGGLLPALLALTPTLTTACTPELEGRPSELRTPRVLAVQAEPAEAAPRATIALRALHAAPDGAPPPPIDWAFCVARKPLTEPGTIASTCLSPDDPALAPLGVGTEVQGVLPDDGCRLFGPDRPPPVAGEPAGRAVDPDPTGGFYQPVRLLVQGEPPTYATFGARITCGVASATPAQAAELRTRYRSNHNPEVTLSWVHDGLDEALPPDMPDTPDAPPAATLTPGEVVPLRAAWAPCPEVPTCGDGICGVDEDTAACTEDCATPRGCTGAEPYVAFDAEASAVTRRREVILVSWFATAGTLDADRTGRAEGEPETTTDNTWTAPDTPGEARLWVVIRDDRGGTGWQSYRFTISP